MTFNLPEFKEFCKLKHGNQKRNNGQPYFENHCVKVAEIAITLDELMPENLIQFVNEHTQELFAIGLAHDLLEDTNATYDEILNRTNQLVADSVRLLTKNVDYDAYLTILCQSISEKNILAILVKLADLQHNSSDLNKGSLRDKYKLAAMYIRSQLIIANICS
jgi:(p)ppGpp synthase/HD superfamily hydrolase